MRKINLKVPRQPKEVRESQTESSSYKKAE